MMDDNIQTKNVHTQKRWKRKGQDKDGETAVGTDLQELGITHCRERRPETEQIEGGQGSNEPNRLRKLMMMITTIGQ